MLKYRKKYLINSKLNNPECLGITECIRNNCESHNKDQMFFIVLYSIYYEERFKIATVLLEKDIKVFFKFH